MSTVVSVASSIATHIRPILLATSARFMREQQAPDTWRDRIADALAVRRPVSSSCAI